MKKSLLAAMALSLTTGAFAQLPDGSVAPDFTGTDINGNSWHLYDLLDQGYSVVMDISATWCGPCWNYHNSGNLENLYNTYGPGTSYDKVMVLFVEGDGATTGADLVGTGGNTQGNWVAGTPYPILDNASIANSYQITYFPTIYTICPNRVLVESGQISTAAHWAIANACPAAVAGTNAALLTYNSETIVCSALDMEVTMQNMGTNALTSCTIAVKEGANVIATQNWSGNLATYNTTNVTFPAVNINNPGAVTVQITSSDADASDNTLDPGLAGAPSAMANLIFTLNLDYYCSETTWKLFNSSNVAVQQGGPYNCSGNGGGADAHTQKVYNWTVPYGCYKLEIYDAYGDGMASAVYNHAPDGSWDLKDGSYTNLWSGSGDFGDATKGGLDVNSPASVEENTLANSLQVGPNPTDGLVTLNLNLASAGQVTVLVHNLLGEVVMGFQDNMSAGTQLIPMSLDGLENGIYLFTITAGDQTVTRKVTLNK